VAQKLVSILLLIKNLVMAHPSIKCILLSAVTAVIFSCNNESKTTTEETDTTNKMSTSEESSMNSSSALSSTDQTFVSEAAAAGMMEVEAGKLAAEKGTTQAIKDFGQMMVTDHSAANSELQSLAATKNATVPSEMSESARNHVNDMKNMTGKEFDDHFKQMMVSDHEKAVKLFEDASQNCNDPDLKTWATNTLPKLKGHLEKAKALK
jgi:putative membrane protein